MRQHRKATKSIAIGNAWAINETWIRNTFPTVMEKSQCLPVLQLLLASSKTKPELYYVVHTNNWLHLSPKKPFRDSRKWLYEEPVISSLTILLLYLSTETSHSDMHDIYKTEVSRPTQQLYLPCVKIWRTGHRNVTRLAECFPVWFNS